MWIYGVNVSFFRLEFPSLKNFMFRLFRAYSMNDEQQNLWNLFVQD